MPPDRAQPHPRTRLATLLAVGLWGALAACSEPSPPAQRALVVGLDGATDKVIAPLVARGELPHLARLAREGAHGSVRPGRPILSPRIWTTYATGHPPEEHGIADWVQRGDQGQLRLYSNLDRRVPALWNIASAAGREVGVVNWLITQPPDQVNGVMISDHAVPGMTDSRLPMARDIANQQFGSGQAEVVAPEVAVAYAWPTDWVERSEQIRGDDSGALTDVANPFTGPDWQGHAIFDFLRSVYRDDERTVATALEVAEALRPDLLLVYLPGIDRTSHLLWQGIETPAQPANGVTVHPPALRATHRRALLDYYRFTDALLGLLLEGFGPDDFVLVLSDHGFEASNSAVMMPGIHDSDAARDGVLYARGPGIAPGSRPEVIDDIDVLPTLLAATGLPLADALPGEPAPFVRVRRPPPVASYQDVPVQRVDTPASEVDETILEKLRTLGYVE